MKTSENINELSAALAKALGVIRNPAKDATNPHFRSKYSALDSGLNVIREALSLHGIAFAQTTRMEGDVMMLDTRLMHGNQWIESEYPVARFPSKPQEVGSALTYARRYSLYAIVGVAGEEDDDANAAVHATPAPRSTDVKRLIESINECESPEALAEWYSQNSAVIGKLPDSARSQVRQAYGLRKSELTLPEAAE